MRKTHTKTRFAPGMMLTVMVMVTLTMVAMVMMALTAADISAAAGQDAAQIKRGQEVYAAQKCQMCHSIAGKGGKQNPLDGVGTKLSAEDTKRWITHPAEMSAKAKSTKKPPMPAKYASLPAADLDALVAYMQSLK
jgi:mono/diheme cytochrome c family protein